MKYINQLNAYWNWVKLNPLPSRAGYLYFAILDCANTAGWKREFNAPNSTLQAMAGLDKNGLSRYRNVLIQQGLIEYRQGNRGNTGIYKIVPLYGNQIDTQDDTQDDTQTEPKLIPKVGTYIDKEKDKDKDKPPKSPKGWGDVSPALLTALADFEEMRKKMRKPLTERAKQLNLSKLRKLAPDEKTQIAIVERSIERSWQGFYALDKQDEAPPPQDKFLTLEDIYGQRGAERFRRGYARPESGGAGL